MRKHASIHLEDKNTHGKITVDSFELTVFKEQFLSLQILKMWPSLKDRVIKCTKARVDNVFPCR